METFMNTILIVILSSLTIGLLFTLGVGINLVISEFFKKKDKTLEIVENIIKTSLRSLKNNGSNEKLEFSGKILVISVDPETGICKINLDDDYARFKY